MSALGGFSLPGGSSLPGGGCLLPGGFSLPGGDVCSQGGSPCPETSSVNRITHMCKNITLATTSLQPVTRMHSSRMRTGRSLTVCRGGFSLPGGFPARGVSLVGGVSPCLGGSPCQGGSPCPGGVPAGGFSLPGGVGGYSLPEPPPRGQNHRRL